MPNLDVTYMFSVCSNLCTPSAVIKKVSATIPYSYKHTSVTGNGPGALGLNMEINSTKLKFSGELQNTTLNNNHIKSPPVSSVCICHNKAICVRTIIDCRSLCLNHFHS